MKKILCVVLTLAFFSTLCPLAFAEKDPISAILPTQDNSITEINTIFNDGLNISGDDQGAGQDDTSAGDALPHKAKYMTLMLYMCGSTMEGINAWGEESYLASSDLYEICSSGVNSKAVNILLYAGGCRQWGACEIIDGTSGIYQITDGRIIPLVNDGKQHNMGDPDR